MTLDLPDVYRQLSSQGEARALKRDGGAGFVCLGSSGDASLVVDETKALVTVKSRVESWKPGQMVSVGLIVYPVASGLKQAPESAAANELRPLTVRAKAILPEAGELKVVHEKDQGWHRIGVPKGSEGGNGQMRAKIAVSNPDPFPRVVRLNFDGHTFYIPGISAVLRDIDGYPNLFVSATVAATTGGQAQHIRKRGFDSKYYPSLLEELIRVHGPIGPHVIIELFMDKQPDSLDDQQKRDRIRNLTYELAHRSKVIENISGARGPPPAGPSEGIQAKKAPVGSV